MFDRIDAWLFVMGLVIFTLGQIAINAFGAMTKDEIPIDVMHWLMLIGAVLLIPFAARLPRRGLALVASPLLILGIVCVIGMCVLDFVFWSLPDDELRGEVARRLMDTPMLWKPFIAWGPDDFFNLGLVLPTFLFFRVSKFGTAFVVMGTLSIVIGTSWFNVAGYVLITLGYFMNFDLLRQRRSLV